MDTAPRRTAEATGGGAREPAGVPSTDRRRGPDPRKRIAWLGEAACHDPYLVGGKAASLSRLAERYPVPPGFSLTTAAFDRAERTGPGGSTRFALPEDLRAEIAAAYARLGELCGEDDPPVAVRSSAVDEDGTDASFAGQHETFLNISGVAALSDAIRDCWVSFHTPHAIEYRRKQGLPIEGVRVAVLVQQLVVADVSAVVFTADPVTGDRDQVVINASWGLGESIVGGTVTPDTYRVRKRDLSVVSRHVAEKRRMTVAGESGTPEVDVPSFLRSRPALADGQAEEMARLGHDLEESVGRPVDIECEFRSDTLYLLQCRPITTLGPRAGVGGES